MKKLLILAIGLLALFLTSFSRAAINPASPFQVLWDDEVKTLKAGEPFHLTVTIRAPENYYLYAEDTEVEFVSLEGIFVTDIHYPRGEPYTDPFMRKTVNILKGDAVISIKGRVPDDLGPGDKVLTAVVRYRGCSPTLCYRQEEKEITFKIKVEPQIQGDKAPTTQPTLKVEESKPIPKSLPEKLGLRNLLRVHDFSQLLARGTLFTVFIVLLAGLLTSLTPCVWPIIPVVLLYVGVHPHKRFWQNFLLSALMVAGLVFTYAILGIAAVAFGKNLGFLFQQRWFLALVVLFFIAMSLSMFGVFNIRMPQRLHARLHRMGGEGYFGAFFAGMALGLVASPCSGPVLAALLGYVALQANYLTGFALLIVYGIGMGILMILLGACYGELAGKLRGGAWMLWIRRTLGLVLLFPAAYYMGVFFNWSPLSHFSADTPHIEWQTNENDALNMATKTGKPIMMEFTAEWCPPCNALERDFFSRTDITGLSHGMIPLRVDATLETKDVRDLISRYHVIGWPTVIFMAPHGKIYDDLRVNDYDPPAVEQGMREAIIRAKKN